MKLSQLLEITTLDTTIQLDGINSNRIKKNLLNFRSIDEFKHHDTTIYNICIEKYGNENILNQTIENGKLVILIKYEF